MNIDGLRFNRSMDFVIRRQNLVICILPLLPCVDAYIVVVNTRSLKSMWQWVCSGWTSNLESVHLQIVSI